jgi:hypothetical protein
MFDLFGMLYGVLDFMDLLLFGHIIFGVEALVILPIVAVVCLKYNKLADATTALWTGLAVLMLAWFCGGWYYVEMYGDVVKPVIKSADDTKWVHSLIMEHKEHWFLLIPALYGFTVLYFKHYLAHFLETNPGLKTTAFALLGTIMVAAVFMAAEGGIITATVRMLKGI